MSDLVERLRGFKRSPRHAEDLCKEAAVVIERLRAEVDRLAACKFPDSRSIYVVTLPNGERWACADVVGAEIERLRTRVAELEQERNEARSLLSTVNSSDY